MTTNSTIQSDKALRNLLSLERYWFYAEKMRGLLFRELPCISSAPLSQTDKAQLLLESYAIYMSYWLASLNVVIEGYEKLSISDAEIDMLLSDNRRVSLQRFRNAIFHYQPDYFTPKLFEFFSGGSLDWAKLLHERLGPVLRARITAAQAAPDAKNSSPGR